MVAPFAKADFDVIKAKDSEEALRRLKTISFDVVLTDLLIPETNGLALLEKVHKFSPELPVVGEFGISPKTGYEIFDRYQECGIHGLTDRRVCAMSVKKNGHKSERENSKGVCFQRVKKWRPGKLGLPTFWFVDRITFCVVYIFKRMEFRSAVKITVFGLRW